MTLSAYSLFRLSVLILRIPQIDDLHTRLDDIYEELDTLCKKQLDKKESPNLERAKQDFIEAAKEISEMRVTSDEAQRIKKMNNSEFWDTALNKIISHWMRVHDGLETLQDFYHVKDEKEYDTDKNQAKGLIYTVGTYLESVQLNVFNELQKHISEGKYSQVTEIMSKTMECLEAANSLIKFIHDNGLPRDDYSSEEEAESGNEEK